MISCPSCAGGDVRVFYEVRDVPANSCILLSTEEEARRYQRRDVRLGLLERGDGVLVLLLADGIDRD